MSYNFNYIYYKNLPLLVKNRLTINKNEDLLALK